MLQYLQQLSYRLRKMLMLLSMHMTSGLFLLRFNNFTLAACMGLYWSYTLLLQSPFLCALDLAYVVSCQDYFMSDV